MKYFILVGESSGDMYGARLIESIKSMDGNAEFKFWGGPQMFSVDKNRLKSIEQTSFMGLTELVKKLGLIRKLFKNAKADINQFKPDIVIFIDYPGFNLRMAKWCHQNAYKVAYYISPQIWAWRKYRYKSIKKYTDLFFVILPFEQKLYQTLGVKAHYFGHPILEHIKAKDNTISNEIQKVGLFPGSRIQEIEKHLALMLCLCKRNPGIEFIVSTVAHMDIEIYRKYIPENEYPNLSFESKLEKLLSDIDFAIAVSGTITLQLALHQVPQIVIYRASNLSYRIAKSLINLDYISLVNLIEERQVVPELIQDDLNEDNLQKHFIDYSSRERRIQTIDDYNSLRHKLGEGNTSNKIAGKITEFLKK